MNPPETSEERTNKKILGNPEAATATTREGQMALSGKFSPMQVMRDLTAAREAAIEAAKDVNDEGTCNFDHCRLRFPRLRTTTVEAVGGLRQCFGQSGAYQVDNPIPSQAAQRTIQAETICKVMKERGYDAYVFYMMD